MSELTSTQHASLGCGYVDEWLDALHHNQWCFGETFGIEKKISEHAEALGIAAPLTRPQESGDETDERLQIWLAQCDPVTGIQRRRLIMELEYSPPPATKGTVCRTRQYPLSGSDQADVQQFARRLKREMLRRAEMLSMGQSMQSSLDTDTQQDQVATASTGTTDQDQYILHVAAVAMLNLGDVDRKRQSKVMETIRKRAGESLRRRLAAKGRQYEYHLGDWTRIVQFYNSVKGSLTKDDWSGLDEGDDEEKQQRQRQVRQESLARMRGE